MACLFANGKIKLAIRAASWLAGWLAGGSSWMEFKTEVESTKSSLTTATTSLLSLVFLPFEFKVQF